MDDTLYYKEATCNHGLWCLILLSSVMYNYTPLECRAYLCRGRQKSV